MLQPRLPLRRLQQSCKSFSAVFSRTYATVDSQPTPPASDALPVEETLTFTPATAGVQGRSQLKRYKPITPGIRHLVRPINDHLWKGRPVKELTFPKKGHAKGGRNNTGHVTVRHRGGGHKRRIRTVDFTRDEPGPHVVERIEHDPGRSAHIALLKSKFTKKLTYILAADGMREGDVIESYMPGIPEDLMEEMGGTIDLGVLNARAISRGNCLPLHMIPIGTFIYNVGLRPGKGGQLCRSAGTHATVVGKIQEWEEPKDGMIPGQDGVPRPVMADDRIKALNLAKLVPIRLQSGEVRYINKNCCATVGVASNINYEYAQLGKAGRARWLNIRPTVRGLAMNAMDHPHGGGRGKSKGNVNPKSPWGVLTKGGHRTRPRSKVNKAVITPRVRNQGKRRSGN